MVSAMTRSQIIRYAYNLKCLPVVTCRATMLTINKSSHRRQPRVVRVNTRSLHEVGMRLQLILSI